MDYISAGAMLLISLVSAMSYVHSNFATKKEVEDLRKEIDWVKSQTDNKVESLANAINALNVSVAQLQTELTNINKVMHRLLEANEKNSESITKILGKLDIK